MQVCVFILKKEDNDLDILYKRSEISAILIKGSNFNNIAVNSLFDYRNNQTDIRK